MRLPIRMLIPTPSFIENQEIRARETGFDNSNEIERMCLYNVATNYSLFSKDKPMEYPGIMYTWANLNKSQEEIDQIDKIITKYVLRKKLEE